VLAGSEQTITDITKYKWISLKWTSPDLHHEKCLWYCTTCSYYCSRFNRAFVKHMFKFTFYLTCVRPLCDFCIFASGQNAFLDKGTYLTKIFKQLRIGTSSQGEATLDSNSWNRSHWNMEYHHWYLISSRAWHFVKSSLNTSLSVPDIFNNFTLSDEHLLQTLRIIAVRTDTPLSLPGI